MRYAVIADIHANLEAFVAVLKDIKSAGGVDGFWCLGDIVGYGPDPGRCIELLREKKPVCVAGNHDLAAIGKLDLKDFNPDAAEAIRWTTRQITDEDKKYLESLPKAVMKEGFTLIHGSPREPVWEYLASIGSALVNFNYLRTQNCLVGHSHQPLFFHQQADGKVVSIPFDETMGQALSNGRYIINPGGIGQPRDGDPRASYAIYDSQAGIIKLHRVAYDYEETQKKIMKAGLPLRLSIRLAEGV